MAALDLTDTLESPRRDSVQHRFWRRLEPAQAGYDRAGHAPGCLYSLRSSRHVIAGFDPVEMDLKMKNKPPSAEHILGTDAIGRDVWARLVYGARVSLSVGLVAVGIYTSIALVLGSVSGYASAAMLTMSSCASPTSSCASPPFC